MDSLGHCLEELWGVRGEEVAMVQRVGEWREEVSYARVYEWIKTVKVAVDGGTGEWLRVGLNVAPFSIEETALVLLVAQQMNWSYVPVDAQLPVAKQLSILKKARVQRLVTTPNGPLATFLERSSGGLKAQTVEWTTSPFGAVKVFRFSDDDFHSEEESEVHVGNEDEAPLYILFTSGTTGEPRGVVGTREGTWTRLEWMWRVYPFGKAAPGGRTRERVLRATKLSFVDSVWEVLGAFLQRVPLIHLQRPRRHQDGAFLKSVVLDDSALFLGVMQSEQVTRFTAVPSVLEVLLLQTREIDRQSALTQLRYVLSSGEALSLQLLQRLSATAPVATILNLYGSTELSGDVTCMELRAPLSLVQIAGWQQHGIPIANLNFPGVVGDETSLLLVPEKKTAHAPKIIWPDTPGAYTDMEPCTGLLYVSGPLVTPGYVDGTQADDFMSSNALLGGQSDAKKYSRRWFCTGDICSVIQGCLYFCGRKDSAVKIYGQRVYLEAVERAVARALSEIAMKVETNHNFAAQSVTNTHVVAFTSSKKVIKYGLLQQCIVAGIIGDEKASSMSGTAPAQHPQARQLKAWITEHYGSSHSPHHIFVVSTNAVQRLPHGKIDRRALKNLVDREKYVNISAKLPMIAGNKAKGATEDRIARLLKEILGIPTSEDISEDMRLWTFSEMGGNSLLATLFTHELRKELGIFSLTGQDLLHMKIGSVLSIGSPLDKRLRTMDTIKYTPIMDTECDLDSDNKLKRQKKTHYTQPNGPTGGDSNDCTNQWDRLSFVSRYNQSSMSTNGIYVPTCYISTTQQTASTPSLFWELRNAWQVDLGKCIDASPLVVQQRNMDNIVSSTWAIVGSHSTQLVCVDVQDTGREIWRAKLDDRIEACAALSVRHEIVYVGTYAGTFFALDLQSGTTRWLFHTNGIIKASALVIDKCCLVVLGSYDNHIYGLDAATGKSRWVVDLQGSVFSTPLYCAWSGQLFAASTNGKVVAVKSGSDDFESSIAEWKLQLSAPVFAGLNADFASKRLVVGCADGELYGVDMATGVIQWQLATEKPIFSSPCVYRPGSVVFGSHDGKLRKVDCQSGKLLWASNLHGAVFASPTVVRLLYCQQHPSFDTAEESGCLVCCVTTTTGQLYFCDEETGSIIYQTDSSSGKVPSIESSGDLGPLFGSPVLIDSWCLLGTRTNQFFGFEFATCNCRP